MTTLRTKGQQRRMTPMHAGRGLQQAEAHRKAETHRVIVRALFFDDEIVIGLTASDPLDNAIVEREIVVARRFTLG